jgi:hypothetical protein
VGSKLSAEVATIATSGTLLALPSKLIAQKYGGGGRREGCAFVLHARQDPLLRFKEIELSRKRSI